MFAFYKKQHDFDPQSYGQPVQGGHRDVGGALFQSGNVGPVQSRDLRQILLGNLLLEAVTVKKVTKTLSKQTCPSFARILFWYNNYGESNDTLQ
jgi:hypothetical protein